MTDLWALGLLLALGLFWSLGAYNRLIRLRAQAIVAFSGFEQNTGKLTALVQSRFPYSVLFSVADPAVISHELVSAWAGLVGASDQLSVSMKVARQRPLHAESIAALALAQTTMSDSWLRLQQLSVQIEPSAQSASQWLPAELQEQWGQLANQSERNKLEFNQQVSAYNRAITQFPAAVLAWVFGFKLAQVL
ncbi:MAG: LemA family protein [Burkholderiaceae bacterium]